MLFSARVLTLPSFSRKTWGVRPGFSSGGFSAFRSRPNVMAYWPDLMHYWFSSARHPITSFRGQDHTAFGESMRGMQN